MALLLSILLLLFMACGPLAPLQINDSRFCDDYQEDSCRDSNPDQEQVTYNTNIPEYKTKNWRDLGFYLYFHGRQTPGLLLTMNRDMSPAEKEQLKESLTCTMLLQSQQGVVYQSHMEGRRIASDHFWCFDYLGSNLVELMRKLNMAEQTPKQDFFPIQITIKWDSTIPAIRGQKSRSLQIRW